MSRGIGLRSAELQARHRVLHCTGIQDFLKRFQVSRSPKDFQARRQDFPEGGSSTRIGNRASRGRSPKALAYWSKILQSSNFQALHANFRKVLFFQN